MGGGPFKNIIIGEPVSPALLGELAAGHHGTIKVVADIKNGTMAAGGEWHSDCLALLKAKGSNPADCWGAKLNVETGAIVYKSQINQNRPDNRLDEIADETIRATVKGLIDRYFRDALDQVA